MKIALLKASNFLKLRDVEMNPSHTNVIVGKNKQGKTSILKAIQAAMSGKVDASSIRQGADKAELVLELDELTVKRTITDKGNYLDVSNKQGMKMPAPQKYLDGLIGSFSFNPIEFFNLKPKDQRQYLLEAVKMGVSRERLEQVVGQSLADMPVDWEAHALEVVAAVRKFFYDQRTVANAEVDKKRKVIDQLAPEIPADFNPKDVSDEQLEKLRNAISTDEKERMREAQNDKDIARLTTEIQDIDAEIEKLKVQKADAEAERQTLMETVFDTSDDNTIAAAKETLKNLEAQRGLVFKARDLERVKGELNEAATEANRLDTIVSKLTKDVPAQLVKEAKLPVEGLEISEAGITVNGIWLENMSTSEQIRFSLDIVRALNSEFKVILIDGIEALDKESFDTFIKDIENDDYQYFVSRVDGSGPGSFVVEDGNVTKSGA